MARLVPNAGAVLLPAAHGSGEFVWTDGAVGRAGVQEGATAAMQRAVVPGDVCECVRLFVECAGGQSGVQGRRQDARAGVDECGQRGGIGGVYVTQGTKEGTRGRRTRDTQGNPNPNPRVRYIFMTSVETQLPSHVFFYTDLGSGVAFRVTQ